MTRKMKALIIGGSVGGLFAAHLLRRIGWDVVVFERAAADLAGRGAAIGFSEELIDVLRQIGVRLDLSLGVRVRSFIALDPAGAVIQEVVRRPTTGAWSHVYRQLRDTLPSDCYRAEMALERIEQDKGGITAIFADGARVDGDLLIGADGAQSTVRQQLFPGVTPRYAGYVAWRGIVDEADVLPADRDLIFNHLIFCLLEGELLLSIPLPGDDASDHGGSRRCCFIWYRPADFEHALPQLCTDSEGRRHGVSIPPPLIRAEVIRDIKASAANLFAPSIARIVARAKQPLFQAIFDLESPRLVRGRAVLLGDAAFIARPHVVAGVTKAALDSQCLADVLAGAGGDLDAALARYDRERREFGMRIVAYARQLGAHLEAKSGARPVRDPEATLRDYGAPHLFRESADQERR